MTKIPLILLYSRLIIGFLILFLSFFAPDSARLLSISLASIGLLTDIFDGIVARHLGVSNQKLRRLDSVIDQIFFICVVAATYYQCPHFYVENKIKIFVLIGFEGLTYLISYLKFKKEIATHSIGAKIWTLTLFATLIQLIYQCQSTYFFIICFWLGILTRIEILAIILTLKSWANDVPSFYHAIKLRQGRKIKRHKLFNG